MGVVVVLILSALVYIASRPSTTPEIKPTFSFDFDVGVPLLSESQNTPLNQTVNGVTAYFSSPSDPAAFSVTSDSTTFYKLSQFSGKYLYDNNTFRDILDIRFSVEVVHIELTFATIEPYGEANNELSDILLTAYENTNLVGTTKAHGNFSSDSFPQGTLSFSAGQPFNWVRIMVPAQSSGTTDFLVDNIKVTTVSTSSTP